MRVPVTELMDMPWPVVAEYEDLLRVLDQLNEDRITNKQPLLEL